MNIIIEVVATNLASGHISTSQQHVKIDLIDETQYINLVNELKTSESFKPKKYGDILIIRNIICIK